MATGIIYAMSTQDLNLRIPIGDDADIRLLRGALLAAKATELAEMQRRGYRLSTGYGTDSAREGMSAEVAHWRRRIELLDRLIAALDEATGPA